MRSLRSARVRASVRSSSAPASREYPTTSAARVAAIFRVSLIPREPGFAHAVHHRRKSPTPNHPFDRDFGIETAGFGQRRFRLIHLAAVGVGGG